MIRKCANCGQPLTTRQRKYCSQSCRSTAIKRPPPLPTHPWKTWKGDPNDRSSPKLN